MLGLLASSTTALVGITNGEKEVANQTSITKEEVEEFTKQLEKSKTAYENTVKSIKDSTESKLAEIDYTERLTQELGKLVDSEGKVKEGTEKRVKFILKDLNKALGTEFELDGKVIRENGKVVDSYEDLEDQIYKNIDARKAQIKAEEYEELYRESIKREIELQKQRKDAIDEFEKAQNDFYNAGLDNLNSYTYSWEQIWHPHLRDIVSNLKTTSENYLELVDETKKAQTNTNYYGNLMAQDFDNVSTKVEESTSKLPASISKQQEPIKNAMQNNVNAASSTWNSLQSRLSNIDLTNKITYSHNTLYNRGASAANSFSSGLLKNLQMQHIDVALGNRRESLRFSRYATGGLPDIGEMFIAREDGAELVGNIGNRTAVMNNNQIVEAVSSGVARAVQAVMGGRQQGGKFEFYLDGEKLTNVIQRRMNNTANVMGY